MTKDNQRKHDAAVIDQFTRQAIPFTQLSGHLNSIQMLIEFIKLGRDDTVLDVACGPGLVACEFARIAHSVTGIDITEKMIEQARTCQQKNDLTNVTWDIGTVLSLPYGDNSFSVVLTRYSFHHFLEPEVVLEDMIRVCKPGGIVMVVDVALPENKVNAYNRMEKLRDPSHTRALSYSQWEQLMNRSGLKSLKRGDYKVEMELEEQLKASFPNPGDCEKLRKIFKDDIGVDSLGVGAHKCGDEIHFSYPISIYSGNK
jgi:ubiquinone/menaquinone biosynthesis C-methylase UbiE